LRKQTLNMLTTQLNFDEFGNLSPYKAIEVDLDTLESYFVTAFPQSTTRKRLFENYLRYIYRFQDEVFPFFEQYINGSFVTQKENPNDIDIVTFLDFKVYQKRGDKVLDKFWSFSLENEGIDAYLVEDFPKSHPEFMETQFIKNDWKNRYSTNKARTHKKGFLKIIFEK